MHLAQIRADEQGIGHVLEPPYSVRLGPASEPTALIFSGTGWTQMNVELRHGAAFEKDDQLTRLEIIEESSGFTLDRLGQWRVRLSDPVTGCAQEFAVEVVP